MAALEIDNIYGERHSTQRGGKKTGCSSATPADAPRGLYSDM